MTFGYNHLPVAHGIVYKRQVGFVGYFFIIIFFSTALFCFVLERNFVLINCFVISSKKFIVQRTQMYSSVRNIKSLEGYRQYLLSESNGKVGTNSLVSIYKAQTGNLLSARPFSDGKGCARS